MKVPCNRDALLGNSPETAEPSSQASCGGLSPGPISWGGGGINKKHLAAAGGRHGTGQCLAGRSAPRHPGTELRSGLEETSQGLETLGAEE